MNVVELRKNAPRDDGMVEYDRRLWQQKDIDYLTEKSLDRLRNAQYHHMPDLVMQIHLDSDTFGYNRLDSKDASPGVIHAKYRCNASSNHVVLTPWIAMHRLAHMVQAAVGGNHGGKMVSDISIALKEYDAVFDAIQEMYGFDVVSNTGFWRVKGSNFVPDNSGTKWHVLLLHVLTMRSARDGSLVRPAESFAELFAQYVVTGRITLNPFPEKISTANRVFYRKPIVGDEHKKFAARLEQSMDSLIELMTGNVWSF